MEEDKNKISRETLLEVLEEMIKNIEGLPPHAMILPINHYDFCSLLTWLSLFLRNSSNP